MLEVVTRPSASEKSVGRLDAAGAAAGGFEPGLAGVVDPEGYGADTVAVFFDVAGDLAVGAEGGGKDEADFALLEDVAGAVALAGLGPGVGDERHAKGGAVEVGGLAGVADVELDVVGALEGQEVGGGGFRSGQSWGVCCHGGVLRFGGRRCTADAAMRIVHRREDWLGS